MKIARNSRGTIMIVAIAVVVVLASLVLVFSQEMRIEAQAAANRAAALQAGAITRGAVAYVNNHLIANQDPISLDTELISQANPLGDGYFWLLKPDTDDEHNYAYGVTDEASKLNINTATYDMLMKLPNMTTELASSIIDWRDADENISENGGAENEYYLLLADPYYCKNAPFETLEELHLVKGATKELLYGVDANHNGVVDANEQDANKTSGLSGLNGNAACGIMKYLTIYSLEANTTADGKPRTDVNQASTDQLSKLFSKNVNGDRLKSILDKVRPNKPFKSTFDFYFKLGLTLDEFKKIADLITVSPLKIIPGRININTAPKEVLRCLPGIEDGDADSIVTRRKSSGTVLTSTAWILDTLPQGKYLPIANLITTKTKRISADIVGASADGHGFKRARAVFDLRGAAPKLLYYKDLTNMGWPLDSQILDDLRAGRFGGQAATGQAMPGAQSPGTTGMKGGGF